MADYSDPKRGVAFRWNIHLVAQATGQIKTTPTIAAGDFKISKDNGATANLTTLPAEAPAGSGNVQLDISATEMTADLVKVIWIDAAGAEWNSGSMTLGTSAVQMADLATAAALTIVDDFLDTEIAAIKAKTDSLTFTVAGVVDANTLRVGGTVQTAGDLAAMVTVVDDFLDTEVAAIKAKTDNLPAAPAATGDIPSAATVAAAVWDLDATAHQTQGTFGQAIGDPVADTDSIWALVNTNLDAAVSTRLPTASYTSPLSSAGTRGALGMAAANLDTQIATLATAANLATVDTVVDAILVDTAEIGAAGAGLTALASAADLVTVAGYIDTEITTLQTSVDDLPTNTELATALAAADDAVLAAIAALNNLSAAQVNAEVVDALATDTYAEPGQGTPGATISLATKINYLYAALRNKSTVTATEHKIFADDGTTVIVKRTLSDDATTFSSTELATGA